MKSRMLGVAGVGPQKTATTWLHECLKSHPELCLPAQVKETFFFDQRYERGWEWYWSHFEGCLESSTAAEVAPTWFDVPEAITRLHVHNPHCKVLVSLRDPAQRSFSLWLHYRRIGKVGEDFRRATVSLPRIIESSHYRLHLRKWIDRFGRDSVHLIFLDDIAQRPADTLLEIFQFLDLKRPEDVPAVARQRVNPSSLPRFPLLARCAHRAASWLRERHAHGLVEWGKKAGLDAVYRGFPDRLPQMDDGLRAELISEFLEDIEYVEQLAGRELPRWKKV